MASVYASHGWNAMAGKQSRGWKEGLGGGCWTELGHGSRKTPQGAGFFPAHRVTRLKGRTQGWIGPGGAVVLWHGGVAGSLPPYNSGNSGTKAGLSTSNGREGKRWGPGLWVLTVCLGKSLRSWNGGASRCYHRAWAWTNMLRQCIKAKACYSSCSFSRRCSSYSRPW